MSPIEEELERLREQVAALALANVHAAELMAELKEARELEEMLRRKTADLERARETEQARSMVLEAIARNEPLDEFVAVMLEYVRRQMPEYGCSIFVSDAEGLRHVESAGLPEGVMQWLGQQQVGTNSVPGACWRRGVKMVSGVAERENAFEAVCHEHGLKACWGWPVLSSGHAVLGVLALYAQEGGQAGEAEQAEMERMVLLAGLGMEQRNLYERLHYQAHHDALTGLPNRTLFNQRLSKAIQEARQNGHEVAVLWVDLDRFKQVNDTMGHRTGDEVLRQAAARLRKAVRRDDVVARMGGDEFSVCLRNVWGAEDVMRAAQAVIAAFQQPFQTRQQEVVVNASVGVSVYPKHGSSCEELARNADLAMYGAKSAGRGRIGVYSEESDARVRDRFQIEVHLRRALERGELELYYQPQVTVKEPRRVVGVEALLRWDSPELGRVGPDRFIPVAESSGLIGEIGQWVLEEASRTLADWQERGQLIRMAMNVSSEQFSRSDFVDRIRELVIREQLMVGLFELELTESSILKDSQQCQRNMEELRELGVRLAIDDFGTGYSSLSYLHQLPVDAVKIDRSFVKDLLARESNLRLVEGVIRLAKALRLEVVAEGVETAEQLDKLNELGCDLAQGYYIERPMPKAQVEQLIFQTTPLLY